MSATDLVENGDTIVLGRSRQWLVLDALNEMAALCDLLRSATRNGSTEEMLVVRGLSTRIGSLIDAATAAVGDPLDGIADIAARAGIAIPSLEGEA